MSNDSIISSAGWKNELLRIVRTKAFIYGTCALVGIFLIRLGVNMYLNRRLKDTKAMVEVVHPAPKTIDNSLSLPGNFEAIQQASIYAHVAGYLKKLLVDEGDNVKKGQLMAEIDAPDTTQEYNRAKADADLADVTLSRNQELLREKVISQQEYDTIVATDQKAKARLDNAQTNVNYTQIRAPFDGSVARRFKYPGDLIEIGGKSSESPIFIVVNEKLLRIAINVPQIDVTKIQIGFTVDIAVDALNGTILHGNVSRLDELLDASTKTQRVLIDIPNPDQKLHAGMFGTVTLHLDHKDGALAIPKEALIQDDSGSKTWVWTAKGGTLQKTTVTTGTRDMNWVEITKGLDTKDEVLLSASESLKEGTPVDTREIKR